VEDLSHLLASKDPKEISKIHLKEYCLLEKEELWGPAYFLTKITRLKENPRQALATKI
jgi:hypothetical protein